LQYLWHVFRDNFLKIDIYYGQLKSVEVQHKVAYDTPTFFSKSDAVSGIFESAVHAALILATIYIVHRRCKKTRNGNIAHGGKT